MGVKWNPPPTITSSVEAGLNCIPARASVMSGHYSNGTAFTDKVIAYIQRIASSTEWYVSVLTTDRSDSLAVSKSVFNAAGSEYRLSSTSAAQILAYGYYTVD